MTLGKLCLGISLVISTASLVACGSEKGNSTDNRRSSSNIAADDTTAGATPATGDATAAKPAAKPGAQAPAIPATAHEVYELDSGSAPLFSLAPDEGAPDTHFKAVAFLALDTPVKGSAALYRCTAADKTHFLSLAEDCEGGGKSDGLMGFVFTTPQPNTQPLVRCGGPTAKDRSLDVGGATPCAGAKDDPKSALGFVPTDAYTPS